MAERVWFRDPYYSKSIEVLILSPYRYTIFHTWSEEVIAATDKPDYIEAIVGGSEDIYIYDQVTEAFIKGTEFKWG